MDLLQAVILGIVEGITEYLPISSTGHLVLAQWALGLEGHDDNVYAIVIQGGAILAVLGLYRRRVGQMLHGLMGRCGAGLKLAINLIIAFLPALVLGPLLDDRIESALLRPLPVVIALAAGGVLMLFAARWQRSAFHEGDDARSFIDIEHLTWKRALLIGLLQCVAMIPGTSRSMMTIVGGMAVGMRPKHAAEFSFLLGLPTLGGATVFKIIKDPGALNSLGWLPSIVGIAVAFIAAAIAIKWLVAYLSSHGLAIFGWYRLALSTVIAIGLYSGALSLPGNNPPGPEDVSMAPASSIFQNDQPPLPASAATQTVPPTSSGPTTLIQFPSNTT
ncbi:MAG: undecaprenyl-diphosphate phosphatase [Phycisphaerales bacterium]|jgi:undecaprenyl-diphosphatase|nr:undecaprenyl-diphosphate phosphatase [Phycisphaerales bacterium]